MTPTQWMTIFALAAAPAVGSFIGLCADRFGTGRGVAAGRSRCDHCGAALPPGALVPILSWLWIRAFRGGRAACCGARLRLFHPMIETGALILALWAAAVVDGPALWPTLALGWALLWLSAVDLRCFRLPDAGTLPLILGGLALAAAGGSGPILAHALGAAIGYLSLAGIGAAYRRWRGIDGLGLGDAKLFAAAGAWVGVGALPSVLLIACAAGFAAIGAARFGRAKIGWRTAIPFGPGLALGLWLTWLYGPLTLG